MSDDVRPSTAAADTGHLAALAAFDRMTVARLRVLLHERTPGEAYAIAAGQDRPPAGVLAAMFARDDGLASRWRAEAARHRPETYRQRCADAGVSVVVPADPHFPAQLLGDPACPAVLFVQGDIRVLDARRVGIVGTRNATRHGRATAARFGAELAAEGVVVVSGLARGVDGAAHRGALSVEGSRPVGIVGNGLDRPYPREHATLWADVARRGALISEWPPGIPPDPFRFPLRNRILAALVEVLVVVESRERGGSLITAVEAGRRDVDLMAVPGSVHSPASAGTNRLLRDGAAPANETADVLVALGLDHRRAGRARFDPRPAPRGVAAQIVEACRTRPRTLDGVVELTGLPLDEAAMAVARLERDGWLADAGGWFEAIDQWADLA
ncbi:MAG: DNA-protecting protein DprA [Ilumatobacter sp.]|nr:DNA-protecting protein DprA [Ilumatobacter sp.]